MFTHNTKNNKNRLNTYFIMHPIFIKLKCECYKYSQWKKIYVYFCDTWIVEISSTYPKKA
jgi:hypothetical protein